MSAPFATELDPIWGCELFIGRLDDDGYGRIGRKKAHIVAWERVHGPVPEGLVLDHGCAVRRCCSVHHLEAVTQSENLKRRAWRYRAKRKACPKGHDFATNRVVVAGTGGIVCRSCNREAAREREA